MPQDLHGVVVTTLQSSFSTCFDFMFSTLYLGEARFTSLHVLQSSPWKKTKKKPKNKQSPWFSAGPLELFPTMRCCGLLWSAVVVEHLYCVASSRQWLRILKAGGDDIHSWCELEKGANVRASVNSDKVQLLASSAVLLFVTSGEERNFIPITSGCFSFV